MPEVSRIVEPGPRKRTVRADRKVVEPPPGWVLLPPGDAALTRRVKAAGPAWTVQEKKGRRTYSHGVWAAADTVARIRQELAAERADPAYAQRLEAARVRRDKKQSQYVDTFRQAVLEFLAFAPLYQQLAEELAEAVSRHATPVGSGTVARTERIPVQGRAEAAVLAWMRHHTTGYEQLAIARVKGARRKVRRELAGQSRELLSGYRGGKKIAAEQCPFQAALARLKRSTRPA